MPDIAHGCCHCGCGLKTAIVKKTDRAQGRIKGEPARYIKGHQTRATMPGRVQPSEICSIDGCGKKAIARDLCHKHYKKWQTYGNPLAGREEKRAKGSGTVTSAGYLAVFVDGKKKQQHVLVMEKALGRQLRPGEIVHHKDLNPLNNDLANLELCPSQACHMKLHAEIRRTERESVNF